MADEHFSLFEVWSDIRTEEQNINVINNTIQINSTLDEQVAASCIATGISDFIGNKVSINYNLSCVLINLYGNIENNYIEINKNINTIIYFTKKNLNRSNILIRKNEIVINDIKIWEPYKKNFLLLQDLEIGNGNIQIYDNQVVTTNNTNIQNFVNFNTIADNNTKTVYAWNNSLDIFSDRVVNWNNIATHFVQKN